MGKSTKHQAPSLREIPKSKVQAPNATARRAFAVGVWCLELLWGLVLGAWCFFSCFFCRRLGLISSRRLKTISATATPIQPLARVPPRWRKDVERILITDRQIARRIHEMSRQIEQD